MSDRKPRPRCLAMALQFGERGYPIFPAKFGLKESHKRALYSGGAKWGATKDAAQITRDFYKWLNANIGLPTGNYKGLINKGFFVIDCDTVAGHGVDGIANWDALVAKHSPLPPTSMAISPTGSVHYYFKSPAGIKIKGSEGKIARGVDVLGDGNMELCRIASRQLRKAPRSLGNIVGSTSCRWPWRLNGCGSFAKNQRASKSAKKITRSMLTRSSTRSMQ